MWEDFLIKTLYEAEIHYSRDTVGYPEVEIKVEKIAFIRLIPVLAASDQ